MSSEEKKMIILPPMPCKCGQIHLAKDDCDASKQPRGTLDMDLLL